MTTKKATPKKKAAAKKATAIKPAAPAPLAPVVGLDQMMALAVEHGQVDALERLVALHERAEARQEAREFARAMAEFQLRCPPIPKKHSTATSRDGGGFAYSYATLDDIARIVNPILGELGLFYTHDTEPLEGNLRKTTCTLHRGQHSVSASFTGPADKGGRMNPLQQHGSGDSYGRRYSLIYVLGLSTCDEDDDGAASGKDEEKVPTITKAQAGQLEAALATVDGDVDTLLAAYGVQTLQGLTEDEMGRIYKQIESKRKKLAQADKDHFPFGEEG